MLWVWIDPFRYHQEIKLQRGQKIVTQPLIRYKAVEKQHLYKFKLVLSFHFTIFHENPSINQSAGGSQFKNTKNGQCTARGSQPKTVKKFEDKPPHPMKQSFNGIRNNLSSIKLPKTKEYFLIIHMKPRKEVNILINMYM